MADMEYSPLRNKGYLVACRWFSIDFVENIIEDIIRMFPILRGVIFMCTSRFTDRCLKVPKPNSKSRYRLHSIFVSMFWKRKTGKAINPSLIPSRSSMDFSSLATVLSANSARVSAWQGVVQTQNVSELKQMNPTCTTGKVFKSPAVPSAVAVGVAF